MADSISVGRLTINCTVPRNHPSPESVRARLDDVAAGPLRAALAELLAPLSKLGDEVIVIRKLELDFEIDTSRELPDLAQRWAARLAASLAACLRPEARATVARFPDETHYLARFLVDAVAGRPDAWYYKRFRGLLPLALPALLRSAIVADQASGLAALHALPAAQLLPVLRALGGREARRVLETVAAHVGDLRESDALAQIFAHAIPEWLPLASSLPSPWSAGLLLLAQAFMHVPAQDLPRAARLAAAIAAWRDPDTATAADGAASVDDGIAARVLAEVAPSLAPLAALRPAARAQLATALGHKQSRGRKSDAPPTHYTRLGGLLLLLARVGELPLEQMWRDEADRARARLAILARAAGAERAQRVIDDVLLQRLCGVVEAPELDAWLRANHELIARALPTALAARRVAQARTLDVAVTRHRSWGPLQLAIAQPDGDWVAIAPLTRERRHVLRATAPATLDGLSVIARPTLPTAHALAKMLDHVTLPATIIEAEAELALGMAAQQVLRAFARRLPGFAESSPRHLWANFLDMDATVVARGWVYACRLGRPPLATLLNLTGALRGRVTLDFGDGAVLELSA